MRVLLGENPLAPRYKPPEDFRAAFQGRPAWITPDPPAPPPCVEAYRLCFTMPDSATVRVHVTADERYELWLDGQRIGRGPERGDVENWFFESYDLSLTPGGHIVVARVWNLGELAPLAQVSLAPGFFLWADPPYGEVLGTGIAEWQAKRLGGYDFEAPARQGRSPWFAGPGQISDAGAADWDVESGAGEGWGPVQARIEDALAPLGIMPAHMLTPAPLPAQLSALRPAGKVRHAGPGDWKDPQAVVVLAGPSDGQAVAEWQDLVDGCASLLVPGATRQQVILDLDDYVCAYPRLLVSGGRDSRITVCWAEALYEDLDTRSKGQRDGVKGRTFVGTSRDVFLPDGADGRRFESLWWRAGRYIQLLVETGEDPLTIEKFGLEETRYPLEMESELSMGDSRFDGFLPIAVRGLQMCAHETYMDCPYYEQMMYVGDTRLEALTTYAITSDDRLPRKALRMFDSSRRSSGLVQARYPSHDIQYIPPFALWWVAMVHDFASWRDDPAFVASLLPGVRAVMDGFLSRRSSDGMLPAPAGWNIFDWVEDWPAGVPPDGAEGVSGMLNWQLVYALGLAAELEQWAGELELATRFKRYRAALARIITPLFWQDERGLFSDDVRGEHFSEHTQCMALLSGVVPDEKRERIAAGLVRDPLLVRTTIYFTHYLFETYRLLGLDQPLFKRLGLWFDLPAQGFKTTPEAPEPSRSDCHAWGAHPLFHCFATLVGIRPHGVGFRSVEIEPLLGPLEHVSGAMVHPQGAIEVEMHRDQRHLQGTVALPDGVNGTLRWRGAEATLAPGPQRFHLP
jgi:hypothetical protein